MEVCAYEVTCVYLKHADTRNTFNCVALRREKEFYSLGSSREH